MPVRITRAPYQGKELVKVELLPEPKPQPVIEEYATPEDALRALAPSDPARYHIEQLIKKSTKGKPTTALARIT